MKKETQQSQLQSLPDHFTFHHDAGHGWLEVPAATLFALKVQNQISGYSYQHHDKVYLEEDNDLFVFAKAYLLHIGRNERDFKYFTSLLTEVYDGDYSFIRNYSHYKETTSTVYPISNV